MTKEKCPSCSGKGKVYLRMANDLVTCPDCLGTGHIPTKEAEWRSKCHDATVHVVGSDEGTSHYECDQCGKACDFYDVNAPLPSSTQKAIHESAKRVVELADEYHEKAEEPESLCVCWHTKEVHGLPGNACVYTKCPCKQFKLAPISLQPEATQNAPKDHS